MRSLTAWLRTSGPLWSMWHSCWVIVMLSVMEERSLANGGSWGGGRDSLPALYEKMLKTALEEPERIGEIGYLLQMITQKDIIPDEFRELYETFKKTLRLK